jgi:hypothetical protein
MNIIFTRKKEKFKHELLPLILNAQSQLQTKKAPIFPILSILTQFSEPSNMNI